MRRALPMLLSASVLAGCASYHADPLATPVTALAAPDPAILSADAEKLNRPYLAPQTIDLSQPLTPNALAVLAIISNPDLKAQRVKAGVTDAQAFSARLLPDPTFQGNYDFIVGGPDEFDAFGGQLAIDINQIRTAHVVREAGRASKKQVRLDLAWAEWNTAGQARLQGVRVLALTEALKVAKTSAESAQQLYDAAQRAAGRGDISGTDLDARRQALLDSSTKARTAESDLATARSDLNKLLGLPPSVVLKLAEPAVSPVPPAADALVAQAIDRRLDLAALRAGYQVAEADLHKAVLDQFPNLSLTLAAARDTADNYTVGPAIGFTLPLWNRNRGGIATAKATREQLKAEYDARLFQTRAEITAAVAGVETLRRQRDALAGQLPQVERYSEATTRAAKRGDLSPATAATAQQAARDQKLALLQLDQQIAEQTIALELLSGGPSEGWTK